MMYIFYIEKKEGLTSMFAFQCLFIQMKILFAKSLKVFNSFIVVEASSFDIVGMWYQFRCPSSTQYPRCENCYEI